VEAAEELPIGPELTVRESMTMIKPSPLSSESSSARSLSPAATPWITGRLADCTGILIVGVDGDSTAGIVTPLRSGDADASERP
jgi:hypothetical protein